MTITEGTKMRGLNLIMIVALAFGVPEIADAATITVATVNDGDMVIAQRLSTRWEQQTGNKIKWVVLEENVLRQRVTTDIGNTGKTRGTLV